MLHWGFINNGKNDSAYIFNLKKEGINIIKKKLAK